MNIKAKLFFKGEERILLKTSVNYERFIAWNGKPTSSLLDGTITVSFESQMYDDMFIESLYEHRFGKNYSDDLKYWQKLYKPHDGKIVFYEDDNYEIELFQYNFKDAVIIELYEEFDNQYGMFVTMVISPAMQDYRFFEGSTKWEEYSPTRYVKWAWEESWREARKTQIVSHKEPEIEECYIVDFEDRSKRINEIIAGKKIILRLRTQNMVGKVISIDLTNPKVDFKYKGQKLDNDILSNFKIEKDFHEIELETIEEFKK